MYMANNIFTVFVIYYSLFHRELQLFDNKSEIMKYFPENVFGIFTTIKRTHTISHKLTEYPQDVHGCIGYWEPNFNNLDSRSLYDNMLRVSYDSVWSDSRRKYFHPIEKEPDTIIEIDFMLNPIYKINKETGIIEKLKTQFTNKEYGIIIQTKDKRHRATYLPDVFPDIRWNDLVISIKSKAGIEEDDFQLFAYKIHQIKSVFSNILNNKWFNYYCIYKFTRLLTDNMQSKLEFPFPYSCKQNKLSWNSNDQVRNISALSEVFKYANLYQNLLLKSQLKIIKNKIINILNNIDKYNAQSVSFLGYIYPLLIPDKDINTHVKYHEKLRKRLPQAESDFEKQEIIIGLNRSGCNNGFLSNLLQSLTFNQNDSIFKMNWIIQAIISFDELPPPGLVEIFIQKIDNLLQEKSVETNYLAVAFEGLCFSYKPMKQNKYSKTLKDKIKPLKNKIFKLLFELLFILEQRKSCNNTLYAFLDKTSRVDITGHITNGLAELVI